MEREGSSNDSFNRYLMYESPLKVMALAPKDNKNTTIR